MGAQSENIIFTKALLLLQEKCYMIIFFFKQKDTNKPSRKQFQRETWNLILRTTD